MGDESNITELWRGVARRIPPYVQSLAVTHDAGIAIGALCQRGGHRRIIAFEEDLSRADALRERFANVITGVSDIGEVVDAAIVAPESDAEWDALADTMKAMAGTLSPHGCFILLVPTGRDHADIVRGQKLHVLDRWTIEAGPADEQASHFVLVLHRDDYNRFAHAQSLADAGHPDWAIELLAIAEELDPDEEMRRFITMHRYLSAWDDRAVREDRLRRFFVSQSLFAKITAVNPRHAEAFSIHAEFWNRLGDTAMGERLQRTYRYAEHGKVEASRVSTATSVAEQGPSTYDENYRPRLLVVLESEPDYGADVLFDGLADVLGDANVVDFPWKGTLHGEAAQTQQHYPCMFARTGRPFAFADLVQQMAAGQFDGILYCAHTNKLDREHLRALTSASSSTPVYILDQSDSPVNHRAAMAAHIGAAIDAPYFKREMLQCVDYGADAHPLPFAYPRDRLAPVRVDRSVRLFWAGHRKFGLRRLYLEHIESLLGRSFDQQLSQDAYAKQISNARIGLNFFGLGYDTVRYWELPAHGCMLLSERLPIRVPHNFVDGESAVFFDDLEELERHVVYYLERPDEAAQIARAGRVHLERYHTGAARAKQLLARIQRLQLDSATD